jgi:hypothetical protein
MSEQSQNASPARRVSSPPPAKAKPTRQDQLRKLLSRKSGATIPQLEKTFGWQAHTARAAISRLKTDGESVERTSSAKGPVYRIASADAAK